MPLLPSQSRVASYHVDASSESHSSSGIDVEIQRVERACGSGTTVFMASSMSCLTRSIAGEWKGMPDESTTYSKVCEEREREIERERERATFRP